MCMWAATTPSSAGEHLQLALGWTVALECLCSRTTCWHACRLERKAAACCRLHAYMAVLFERQLGMPCSTVVVAAACSVKFCSRAQQPHAWAHHVVAISMWAAGRSATLHSSSMASARAGLQSRKSWTASYSLFCSTTAANSSAQVCLISEKHGQSFAASSLALSMQPTLPAPQSSQSLNQCWCLHTVLTLPGVLYHAPPRCRSLHIAAFAACSPALRTRREGWVSGRLRAGVCRQGGHGCAHAGAGTALCAAAGQCPAQSPLHR